MAAEPAPLRSIEELESDLRRELERLVDHALGSDTLVGLDAVGIESLTNALVALARLRPIHDGPPPPTGNPELELAVRNLLDGVADRTLGERERLAEVLQELALLELLLAVERAAPEASS